MHDISSIFQALGGSGLVDPNMVFVGQFLLWFVIACFVMKFFGLAFKKR